MMNRRESIQTIGMAAAALIVTPIACTEEKKNHTDFRFCLNTSTINGQKLGLIKSIEIAAQAGYDSMELWVRDVQAYLAEGNSIAGLSEHIRDSGLEIANAIGFAPWMSDIEEVSIKGFEQMRNEMELMASIGCSRIAAPPAGQFQQNELNLFDAGEKYRRLIELGRSMGVMPQLEFWGASPVLYHMGQIMMIAAVANDPDVKLLPDVYHMFRGGSGYDSLKMLNGNTIEVFHLNDFVAHIPRTEQKDADRVYPGDGAAPMDQVYKELNRMGGVKHLSLELFNPGYWEQDPLEVAKTGLASMKRFVKHA
jgi:2-keto-myo-inositol isomerase